MKKLLVIFLLLASGSAIFYCNKYSNICNKKTETEKVIISPTKNIKKKQIVSKITNRSIFVPYWNIDKELQTTAYDKYIYFGITANYQGINELEKGYLNLDRFRAHTKNKKTYLTLRLLDNEFNQELLKDKGLQTKIIKQTLEIVNENNFKGVVLDLEIFSVFNEDIYNQINDFVQKFYTATKSDYKSFAIAIYGDVFFRKRPFDLLFLGKNSDEILVMAYDFSKSIGEPGPNFPYETGPDNNYSFKKMVTDFKSVVPKEKISIIFGMYGYDWQVDEKKRPITTAKALTLKKIKEEFIENCQWEDCVAKRDAIFAETEVNYINSTIKDDIGIIDYHIIWFEDEESVKIKSLYLQEQGIDSMGYWVYGYF